MTLKTSILISMTIMVSDFQMFQSWGSKPATLSSVLWYMFIWKSGLPCLDSHLFLLGKHFNKYLTNLSAKCFGRWHDCKQHWAQPLLFLPLLHSQLYLWGSPFWVGFLHMWPFFSFFFYTTIDLVTFCLGGCCMLGVFLLPAFTRLGHECQDLLNPCNGMHVCTDWTLVYTLMWKSL